MKTAIAALLLALGSISCISSQGIIPIANSSTAQFDDADFKVVSTGLRGEASCAFLLGFIPLGDPAIASRAMDQLVASAESTGKSRALANYAGDTINSQFIVFTIRTVQMRADVVEFTK